MAEEQPQSPAKAPKKPRAPRKPKAPPDPEAEQVDESTPTPWDVRAAAEYRAFAATFRRACRASEACALMACYVPEKRYCGAESCPPECPAVGGHPKAPADRRAVPADQAGDMPVLEALRQLAALVAGRKYAREAVSNTEAISDTCHVDVTATTELAGQNILGDSPAPRGGPELEDDVGRLEVAVDDSAEEQLWREAEDRWVAEPAPPASPPTPAVEPAKVGSGSLPCIACGKVKIVMAVVRTANSYYRMCSACYRGATR